jgi:hypothetical protein
VLKSLATVIPILPRGQAKRVRKTFAVVGKTVAKRIVGTVKLKAVLPVDDVYPVSAASMQDTTVCATLFDAPSSGRLVAAPQAKTACSLESTVHKCNRPG